MSRRSFVIKSKAPALHPFLRPVTEEYHPAKVCFLSEPGSVYFGALGSIRPESRLLRLREFQGDSV